MSEVSTDKKLKGKDLITIGIFSAIYFVINFAFMLLGGIHPVLWMLMPGFIAVFAGICFKSVYGSPIFTYMRNYRMNYAAALLKSDKSLKVADVAGLVGYDSPSKFTAAFHQTMGKTPLEYRKSII